MFGIILKYLHLQSKPSMNLLLFATVHRLMNEHEQYPSWVEPVLSIG